MYSGLSGTVLKTCITVSFSPYLLTVLSSCSEQHSYHCDVNAPRWVLEKISLLAKSVTTHVSFLWPLALATAAVISAVNSFCSCQFVFKNSFTVILVEFQERVDASTWAQPGISDFLSITFSCVIYVFFPVVKKQCLHSTETARHLRNFVFGSCLDPCSYSWFFRIMFFLFQEIFSYVCAFLDSSSNKVWPM